MNKRYRIFYTIIFVLTIFLLVSIELNLNKKVSPENILIRVIGEDGNPETNASCKADIYSKTINIDDKPMEELESIYDFIDPGIYYNPSGSTGYYLLNTGFDNYSGEYEIKVVCYSQGNSGVSYTIIDSTNKTNSCEFKQNGKLLVC